jgi:AraC-like DNA-binding protein
MTEHSLPGRYVLYSVELVKRWRVTPEELLDGSGLDLDALADPRTRVPIPAIVGVLERARALTAEPAYGYYLGVQMRVSAHGYLGAAARAARTMREALDLTLRFMPVVTTTLSLRLEVHGRDASLIVDEHADFGGERDTVLLATLIGLWQIAVALSGIDPQGYADLALPAPLYLPELQRIAPRVRFGQPATRLFFEASRLETPYGLADPVALQLATGECERILSSRKSEAGTTGRVRSIVMHVKGHELSLEHVAAALHLSTRTLKRQLAAEGSSFSELVDDERRARATFLLGSPDLSLKDIAGRLGYANLSNFTRAFLRWTGQTPTAYRSRREA